jgi:predicted DCC family thiol-disulfide oxidoreductase YuxK
VVIYDGGCRFCRLCAACLAALDRRRRVSVVPVQDPLGAVLTADLDPRRRTGSLHAVLPGGAVVSGADALSACLDELPAGAMVRTLGMHRLYPAVAARRRVLGRLLPDRPPVRRIARADDLHRGPGA